jgi:hypothetical protein
VRLFPNPFGDIEGIDFEAFPPGHLITGWVQLPMMATAERHCELITDFEAYRPRLRKA